MNKTLPFPTGTIGGVPNPSRDELLAMHEAPYILRACSGKLTKLAVHKSRLPADPKQNHQGIKVVMNQEGIVYARLTSVMCKSADGGRTWTSHPLPYEREGFEHSWYQILKDGTFISVWVPMVSAEADVTLPAQVRASHDEGRTWQMITEFSIEYPGYDHTRFATFPLCRLPDDTLLSFVQVRKKFVFEGTEWQSACTSGGTMLIMHRSTDRGKTWQGPTKFHEWASEGGITILPSGRLLAAIRHQRPLIPTDPPDLLDQMGPNHGYPYKHIFLFESDDSGRTWKNWRQLTTAFGQCYGYPVSLSDGTVVVVHTTPYGPGERGSRAMFSHDEGQTWEDETYYMTFSEPSGYNQSVALHDGTILTVAARNDTEPMTAIRWKPVKE